MDDLLCKPFRDPSSNEYERMRRDFARFLDREDAWGCISVRIALRYLFYLYHDRRLKPGTIAHYRSAISRPLFLIYKIDLRTEDVTAILKAMWRKRPNTPFQPPNWDLNIVLRYIETYNGVIDE